MHVEKLQFFAIISGTNDLALMLADTHKMANCALWKIGHVNIFINLAYVRSFTLIINYKFNLLKKRISQVIER
jgi:hypothetical protein